MRCGVQRFWASKRGMLRQDRLEQNVFKPGTTPRQRFVWRRKMEIAAQAADEVPWNKESRIKVGLCCFIRRNTTKNPNLLGFLYYHKFTNAQSDSDTHMSI